jgi:hypothetical protein
MLFVQVHFFGATLKQVVLKQTNNLHALLEQDVELQVPHSLPIVCQGDGGSSALA